MRSQYYSLSQLPSGIRERIDRDDHCWPWLGTTNHAGYGLVRYDGKRWLAHRLVYTLLVGPIPADAHIDHICYYPRCVYPGHLDAVSGDINSARAYLRRTWNERPPDTEPWHDTRRSRKIR